MSSPKSWSRLMVGFCSSTRFVEHDTGPNHPERPDRIRSVFKALHTAGLLDGPDLFPDFHLDLALQRQTNAKLLNLGEPELASFDWLYAVHTPEHVEHVRHICDLGGGVLDQGD